MAAKKAANTRKAAEPKVSDAAVEAVTDEAKPDATTAEGAAEAVAKAAKPAAKIPSRLRQSRPEGPFVNTTFADRAKARGGNKRVDKSDSK